jgi:hypothetical protein
MAWTDLALRRAMTGALSAVQGRQLRMPHLLVLSGLSVTARHASLAILLRLYKAREIRESPAAEAQERL